MTFNPDTGPCGTTNEVHGGTMCMLLYGHACKPHIGNIHRVAAGLVPPALFEQFRADVLAAREWHRQHEEVCRWTTVAPPRFHKVNLDSLDQPTKIREHLDGWVSRVNAAEPNGTLVLMGPVGCGKTWAAMAVARAIDAVGVDGGLKLISTSQLFQSLQPGGEATIDDYTRPLVLLLDDIGTEKPSEWTKATLFAIIDRRWQDENETIITTNLAPADLRAAVGDRVYDRIRDNATAITLTGPSRRAASISALATG